MLICEGYDDADGDEEEGGYGEGEKEAVPREVDGVAVEGISRGP